MTSFVLVPGAGGDTWFWHRLVPELTRRGHEALAVGLPAADDGAGLQQYADVVVAAVGDRRDVVLVAQSMGGFTAPLVCERVPVRLLVMLNAMTPCPGETGHDWWVNTGQAQAQAAHAAREGQPAGESMELRYTFFHDLPPEVAAQAVAHGGPDQSGRPFEDPWPLSRWPDVPTRFLQGRDDRLFPLDFQRRVVRERLGLELGEMPGGHLLALSRPVELADRLVGYLDS